MTDTPDSKVANRLVATNSDGSAIEYVEKVTPRTDDDIDGRIAEFAQEGNTSEVPVAKIPNATTSTKGGVRLAPDLTDTEGRVPNSTQVREGLADKQDTLVGTQGQFVGFDTNGDATAVAAPTGGGNADAVTEDDVNRLLREGVDDYARTDNTALIPEKELDIPVATGMAFLGQNTNIGSSGITPIYTIFNDTYTYDRLVGDFIITISTSHSGTQYAGLDGTYTVALSDITSTPLQIALANNDDDGVYIRLIDGQARIYYADKDDDTRALTSSGRVSVDSLQFSVKQVLTTGDVEDWAKSNNGLQIPANKLQNAPGGSGGTTLTQDQIDDINDIDDIRTTGATNSTNIATNTTNIASKADTSALTTVSGRVTTNQNAIATNTNNIATKADSSDVTALGTRVSTAEGNITTNTSTIATKADTTTVTAIDSRLSTSETNITTNQTNIGTKADQTDLDSLETKVNQNETDISSLETSKQDAVTGTSGEKCSYRY